MLPLVLAKPWTNEVGDPLAAPTPTAAVSYVDADQLKCCCVPPRIDSAMD